MEDRIKGAFEYIVFTSDTQYFIYKKVDLKYRTYYIDIKSKKITEDNNDLFPKHLLHRYGTFCSYEFDDWLKRNNLEEVWNSYNHLKGHEYDDCLKHRM